MNKTAEYVKLLQNTPSRLQKEAILRTAWRDGCKELFLIFQLTYDPAITFGVKKVPEIDDDNPVDADLFEASTYTLQKFLSLTDKLAKRQLTGHAARDAILAAADECSANEWTNVYSRILLKDMKCGMSETTVNKILDEINTEESLSYKTKIFTCQLATDGSDMKLTGKKFLDVKLDGTRALTVLDVENNKVYMVSRNGHAFENFPDICKALENLLPHMPGSVVLDGEIISKNFNELMKQLRRKTNADTKDAKLALFDIVPLDEFLEGKSKTNQSKRHEILVAMIGMFQQFAGDKVYVIPKMLVDFDTVEGQNEFKQFNNEAISNKFEGVMIKDPMAIYQCKRAKNWLKIKPTITVDLAIDDINEGTGDKAGTFGAFVCSGEHNGVQIKSNVGGGVSDALGHDIWAKRNSLKGFIIEIEADAVSENQNGGFSLRFPRFVRFRGTKPGEKI